jgi:hypothetical protein
MAGFVLCGDYVDFVVFELPIGSDDRKVFDLSLSDKESIKGITMVKWQLRHSSNQFFGSTEMDLNSTSRTRPGFARRGLVTCFRRV